MIAKTRRLSYQDILSVKKSGTTTRISSVLVRYKKVDSSELSKISVSVPKKVAKSSVMRHRIKRIMMDVIGGALKNHYGIYASISLMSFSKDLNKLKLSSEKARFIEEMRKVGEKIAQLS